MNILHIHAGHIHGPGHIAVAVHALLANNSGFYSCRLTAFQVDAILFGFACKANRKPELQRLVFIIGKAF